ncbi:hypothetical protein HDU84_001246 [Entophlyctis sp. JEL0112]|nr:hypothetical protein HDU84_001246 [Entophlyctis sp. JEL0112]
MSALSYEPLPSLREQHDLLQRWADKRTTEVLPALMRQYGVEMWLLSMREYNEDPAFWGTVDRTTVFAARRRTLKAFYANATDFRRWTLVDNTDAIWDGMNAILADANPSSIALNIDPMGNNFADGFHAGEYDVLVKHLPWLYWLRLKPEPLLATQFIATRIDGMLNIYRPLMRNAHTIIREGFASITPGKTTTNDVAWFYRDKIQYLNLTTWFHPNIDIQRYDKASDTVLTLSGDTIIQKGDFVWTDFGVTFMGLNTDTQHVAYVLRDGEDAAPTGLQRGLTEHANVMQDILLAQLKPGRTGNEVLELVRTEMALREINGTVYCHPIGDFGHSAGALVGMTNLQDRVPVKGDLPVFADMWYSIELQANVPVAEWGGNVVNFRQEEDMFIDGDGVAHWVVGRQSEIHLISGKQQETAVSKEKGEIFVLQE